jgi:cytochrome c553
VCELPRKSTSGGGPGSAHGGRSPTYLIRQLLAFQTSARADVTGQPMLPVIKTLEISDMIDVVAYAASLSP